MAVQRGVGFKIKAQLAQFVFVLLVIGGVFYTTLQEVKVTGPLYTEIVQSKDLIADILPPPLYIIESYLVVLQMLGESDPEVIKSLIERSHALQTGAGGYMERREVWTKTLKDGEMKSTLLEASFKPAAEFFRVRDEEFIPALQRNDREAALALAQGPLKTAYEEHRAAIDKLVGLAIEFNAQAEGTSKATVARSFALVIALWCLGVGLAILTGLLFARALRRAMGEISTSLRSASQQVSSAAGQVAQTSQVLAQGASEQAASLEETSASMEQISSSTRQTADNAVQANALAETAAAAVGQGETAMKDMASAISGIRESSAKTVAIIKTIDEIAFQTNLLALNAAVEAARAGDAGRGFAVVAEEVRNLAQRSAEAARNTSELIDEACQRAEDGVKQAARVNEILNGINESTGKVVQLVAEVSAATNEQSRGLTQVNDATNEMDKVTQSNAASAEESSAAAEQLSAQASELLELVAELVTFVEGGEQHGGHVRH